MKLAIIKYNAGNIRSVLYALERIGATAIVTDDGDAIRSADKVIFPGVGEAGSAMNYLKARKMDLLLKELTQPVLGICLGMQLMCTHSEESDTPCLGMFDTGVKKFMPGGLSLKVPHMGWNEVSETSGDLFEGLQNNSYCYFVHSYYADLCASTAATTTYGIPFSSVLAKNNFYGVQFHPEKSASTGETILKNFLNL